MLNDERFAERLEQAVTEAWSAAEELAPKLITAAERQLRSAVAAMERLSDLGDRILAGQR
jgi:hypothetical protein